MSPPISPPNPFTPQGNSNPLDRWVPACALLRNYSPAWLANDLFAGLVLTAMLVPAGMAYAQAAGLPAICGLYATIVPLLVYAVFGPSRVLVLGPDSSLAPLIAAAILPLAAGNAERALSLAEAATHVHRFESNDRRAINPTCRLLVPGQATPKGVQGTLHCSYLQHQQLDILRVSP